MASREEKNKFSMMIMERAYRKRMDHMDAITSYCEETNLEIEMAATLVNEPLKEKIQEEAQQMRYLPQVSRLPF